MESRAPAGLIILLKSIQRQRTLNATAVLGFPFMRILSISVFAFSLMSSEFEAGSRRHSFGSWTGGRCPGWGQSQSLALGPNLGPLRLSESL